MAFINATRDYYRQQVDKTYNNYTRNQQIGAEIEIADTETPESIDNKLKKVKL